jgi:hypothetical protein
MADKKIFSLEGKGLKLDTAEDIEPHIKELRENDEVEEVLLLGNTLGIGASEALAKVLETKKKLQVSPFCTITFPLSYAQKVASDSKYRLQTSPTSSLPASSPKSHLPSRTSSPRSSRCPTYAPSTSPTMPSASTRKRLSSTSSPSTYHCAI